jgi:hypothetical protein
MIDGPVEFRTKNGDVYVYDFEQMSMEQIMTAETFFKLHDKMLKVMPATPNDLMIATDQMSLKQAYAALLLKRLPDGTLEPFSSAMLNTEALRNITGTENRKKLEEIKADFFVRSGSSTPVSMEQLENLMNVVKLMPESIQNMFYEEMLKGVAGSLGNSFDKSSLTTALEEIGLEQ